MIQRDDSTSCWVYLKRQKNGIIVLRVCTLVLPGLHLTTRHHWGGGPTPPPPAPRTPPRKRLGQIFFRTFGQSKFFLCRLRHLKELSSTQGWRRLDPPTHPPWTPPSSQKEPWGLLMLASSDPKLNPPFPKFSTLGY